MPEMNKSTEEMREKIVKKVKAAGEEIIEQAEDIVGYGDMMGMLEITVTLEPGACTEIEIKRKHFSRKAYEVEFEYYPK